MSALDLASVGEPARSGARRLREGLLDIFDTDLVSLWLYGGQLNQRGSPGDVDLHGILRREPDADELARIRALHAEIERDLGIGELDAWHVLMSEAASGQRPRDVNWPVEVHDENWALKRAHWFAGAYVLVHGVPPDSIVPRPTWPEVEQELLAQVANAGSGGFRHHAGLTLRLCRVLHSLVTRDVVHFKVDSSEWALSKLPSESHAHVAAAIRTYLGKPRSDDAATMREGMPRFYEALRRLVDETLANSHA